MAAAVLWSGEAAACVTKTGKDCPVTVGHKAKGVDKHVKKVGKIAPAGNVGSVTHATGIDSLGLPSTNLVGAPPAPVPPDSFGSNPAGWFYLGPTQSGGFAQKPVPFTSLSRAQNLVNRDGTLTQHAIDTGWLRVQAAAPSLVGAPTAQQVVAPSLTPPRSPNQVQSVAPPAAQPAAPSQRQAPPQRVSTPAPSVGAAATPAKPLVPTPNLAGHAASGTARAHPDHPVDVYHPVKAGLYRYQDAHGIGDSAFHLVVVGIGEPDAR